MKGCTHRRGEVYGIWFVVACGLQLTAYSFFKMHLGKEKSLLLRRQSFQPKGANEQRKWGSKLIGIV
jgi:hypothetical protein